MDFKNLEWNETEASRVQSLDISALNKEIVEARDSLMAVQRAGKTDDHDEASLCIKTAAESGEFGEGVTEAQLKDAALKKARWVENAQKIQIDRTDADRINRAAELRIDALPDYVPGSYVGATQARVRKGDLMNFYFEANGDGEGGREKFQQMLSELQQRVHGRYEMPNVPAHQIFNFTGVSNVTDSGAASQNTGLIDIAEHRDPRDVTILNQPEFSIAANLPTEMVSLGNSMTFMREKISSSHGLRAVTGVKEGESAPNQTVETEDVTVTVQKRAVSMGITEEQTADVPQAARFINRKMSRFMAEDLENQVVNGSGTGQNMTGIFAASGTQTQTAIPHANASDKNRHLEHVLNAFTLLYDEGLVSGARGHGVGNTMPSFLAVRWPEMKQLMLSKTTQNEYLWGSAISGRADRIWGVPIILAQWLPVSATDSNHEGTQPWGLTLNTADLFILYKQGLTMEWGISDDDFLRGQRRLRMVYRAQVGVERPSSIVKINFGQLSA